MAGESFVTALSPSPNVQALHPSDPNPTQVRTEKVAFEWTPVVRRDGDGGDGDDAKGVDRRDRYRKRMTVGGSATVEG